MSVLESTHLADENLRLRREVTGLRQAMNALSETNDAMRRENQRLRDVLRLIGMETERHRLAIETHSREVGK